MIGLIRAPTVEGPPPALQHPRASASRYLQPNDGGALFHRHRILTQVAADNVNIIKLLPPLICGQEEIDYFVAALDDVLKDAHSGSGLSSNSVDHGQGCATQVRKGSPSTRRTILLDDSNDGNGNGNGISAHLAEAVVRDVRPGIAEGDRVVVTGASGFHRFRGRPSAPRPQGARDGADRAGG